MPRLLPPILALALLLASPAAHAAQEPERVIMKLDEFLKLYEKNRAEETQAPIDFAISSARYQGDVQLRDGEPYAAVFTARLADDVADEEELHRTVSVVIGTSRPWSRR